MQQPLAPSRITDRFDVYRFFNGIAAEGKEGLDRGRTRMPLVKSFLLEHVACRGARKPSPASRLFAQAGAEISQIDESFFSLKADVTDPQTNRSIRTTTGFLEQYNERFFAYYTCEDAQNARKRVSRWIQHPDLDATWFSSPLLQVLWNEDISRRGDELYGKLVFRHESIFEMPENFATEAGVDEEISEDSTETEVEPDEEPAQPDRRRARFVMGDRIGRIKAALGDLQKTYAPLNALYAQRLPSRSGRGGHELYQHGQITNRADSFEDHRNTVRYLYRIYKSVLTRTEELAWQETASQHEGRSRVGTGGEPLIVEFAEPLSKATFEQWVQRAFRKRNAFKLWGDPIRLGPTKVHAYGADRHLWQPINLELTNRGLVAILPRGTCGNTFHRLVANLQRYVSPQIQAWIGSQSFESVVSRWPGQEELARED